MTNATTLGTLKPLGGGDPIPLKKAEIVIGRRRSSDIRLDFDNISGRHCILTFANGLWNVRDLGSTNGTKLNGQKLQREQGVMPDDQIAIASHLFSIDYEPSSHAVDRHLMLEDEELRQEDANRRQTSLMDLAGFSELADRTPKAPKTPAPAPPPRTPERPNAAEPSERQPVDIFSDDDPDMDPPAAPPVDDDDFLKMIEDDIGGS